MSFSIQNLSYINCCYRCTLFMHTFLKEFVAFAWYLTTEFRNNALRYGLTLISNAQSARVKRYKVFNFMPNMYLSNCRLGCPKF